MDIRNRYKLNKPATATTFKDTLILFHPDVTQFGSSNPGTNSKWF